MQYILTVDSLPRIQTLLNGIHQQANRIKEQYIPNVHDHAINILAYVILLEEELHLKET